MSGCTDATEASLGRTKARMGKVISVSGFVKKVWTAAVGAAPGGVGGGWKLASVVVDGRGGAGRRSWASPNHTHLLAVQAHSVPKRGGWQR